MTQLPLANAIRALSMDAVEKAQSGHCGLPLGFADVATLLYQEFLKFDAAAPDWPDRDRVVLSAGHGSMLLYSLLYLTGYPEVSLDEIRNFRQLGSKTPGHPEFGHTPGVETTTGPLGQGLANAVGMAIAERHLNARFGDELVNHKTWVIAGDGCLMEGISQEALTLAGHMRLKNLIVLFDDNAVTIDGSTALSDSTDQIKRFKASGWNVARVDGHNMDAVRGALLAAQGADRPSLIACKTIIGFGAKIAGTGPAHGGPYGAEEIRTIRAAIDWPHEPFVVPEEILAAWRKIGGQGARHREAWVKRLGASAKRGEFEAALSGKVPEGMAAAFAAHKKKLAEAPKADATRKWSGAALEIATELMPEMVGGSADLTGSNNTRTASAKAPMTPENYGGRYVHWGIREHAMAAAMNGMALHGGITPYSGTFLVFSDYSRPAIRLGALMGQRVIHVMTHDSIGVGEDGPTHQPVEHVASLRMIPNLLVFRPCDGVETAEAWEVALGRTSGPSLLALTRQNLAPARKTHTDENLVAKGGYVLSPATVKPEKVVLVATGSEVEIALEAQKQLEADGIGARVVSLPCFALFGAQPAKYQAETLGKKLPKVAVEAGVRDGWDRWIGPEGGFVGMTGFGASAPAKTLFKHFGITAEAVVKAAKERV